MSVVRAIASLEIQAIIRNAGAVHRQFTSNLWTIGRTEESRMREQQSEWVQRTEMGPRLITVGAATIYEILARVPDFL